MLETIQSSLAPYYMYIKFIHVFFVMIWAWSTAVAYSWYVKGAFLRWEKHPDDPVVIQRRNWAIEQFDKGVVLEHVAFPIILITGPLLYFIGPWNMDFTWLLIKLAIVAFVFVPVEIFDYWLSHFGGNKSKLRRRNEMDKYEKAIQQHWKFLKISTPIIIIFVPSVLFLAIVKPM
ncbi:MAG: hypothetical protein MI976_25500 [Pseudomonadales bacterium]|nr:hypothetical protein [Pseudomonadales bacterium]